MKNRQANRGKGRGLFRSNSSSCSLSALVALSAFSSNRSQAQVANQNPQTTDPNNDIHSISNPHSHTTSSTSCRHRNPCFIHNSIIVCYRHFCRVPRSPHYSKTVSTNPPRIIIIDTILIFASSWKFLDAGSRSSHHQGRTLYPFI